MAKTKKFISTTLIGFLTFSSVSLVSAAPVPDLTVPLDSTVPPGYQVIKEYDTTDASTKVDMLVEGKTLLSETQQHDKSGSISNDFDSTNTEILKNETHIYRDLQNIETGDVIQQYKTDLVVASDPYSYSGSSQTSDKSIKLTISLYYHQIEKNNFVWMGMDKAYWRFDKGSSPNSNIIPYLTNYCTMVQTGPGINNYAQNQKSNCSPLGGDLSFGKTYLATAPSGWVEVLDEGLNTSMGLKIQARFLNQSTSKVINFDWALTIEGVGPWG